MGFWPTYLTDQYIEINYKLSGFEYNLLLYYRLANAKSFISECHSTVI